MNPSPYDNPHAEHLDKGNGNNGQPEDRCDSIETQAGRDACKIAIITCGEGNVDRTSASTTTGGGGGANVSLGKRGGGLDVDVTTQTDIEVFCNSKPDPNPHES